MSTPVSRRTLLAGAGAVVGGALWIGTQRGAAAASTGGRTTLTVLVWDNGIGDPNVHMQVLHQSLNPWLAQHPGVDILLQPDLYGDSGPVMAEILAGGGPDIYHSWHPEQIFAVPGFAVALDPYIKRDNLNLSVFNSGQVAVFQRPEGLLGLPYYLGTTALMVNLAMFDQAGVAYPSRDWTYTEHDALARAMTKPNPDPSKYVWGTTFGLGNDGAPSNYLPPPCVLQGFGGAYAPSGDPARCVADSPQAVRATEWAYGLYDDKVLGDPYRWWDFASNQYAMDQFPTYDLVFAAQHYRSMKWDFWPFPRFPQAQGTGATQDFMALNPASKHLDLAWELMRWLAFEPNFGRANMEVYLLSPALNALWPDWTATVGRFAPPLRYKNLDAFVTPAVTGAAFGLPVYSYAPAQANQILNSWGSKINARQISVIEGLTEATRQVNALEAAGPKASAAQIHSQQVLQAEIAKASAASGTVMFGMPPKSGPGSPATPAAKLVSVEPRSRTYTVEGAGAGLTNAATDDATFACSPYRGSRGSFVCRVTSIEAVGSTSVNNAAKVGLMARSSLGSSAALVALVVSLGRGVHFMYRPIAGTGTNDERPTSATAMSGLVGSSVLLANDSKPAANYLLRPIWLRLDLEIDRWTPYTSFDGQTWSQSGQSQLMRAAGCWLGLCVTSHNAGHLIQATFDNLNGFTPQSFVQIGSE